MILLKVVGLYLLCGVLFSLIFLFRGIEKVDPAVAESKRSVKLILFPGLVALWVIFLFKWIKVKKS